MRSTVRSAPWPALLFAIATAPLAAGEVTVVHAEFTESGAGWQPSVTLRHADSGWDHYADGWRIVTTDGSVLVARTLYHPHVDEQPFTRSGSAFTLPPGATQAVVEAHDSVHGWSGDRVSVDFTRESGERYRIRRR